MRQQRTTEYAAITPDNELTFGQVADSLDLFEITQHGATSYGEGEVEWLNAPYDEPLNMISWVCGTDYSRPDRPRNHIAEHMTRQLTNPLTPEQKDALRARYHREPDWEPDQAEPWTAPLHGTVIFTVWSNGSSFTFSRAQRDLIKHVHQQATMLSNTAQRVLAHIEARSISHPETGAAQLHDMTTNQWQDAINELLATGHQLITKYTRFPDDIGAQPGYTISQPVEGQQ